MSSRILKIEGKFLAHTSSAVLIESDRDEKVWLPKAKIELDGGEYDDFKRDDNIVLHVPEWLAFEEGLI